MNACRCVRCGQYWSFNSGSPDEFKVVTRWCPTCVALLPVYGGVV